MKYHLIIIVIVVSICSCATKTKHENVLVSRLRTYDNLEVKIQEFHLRGEEKIWEKNYSYNGWQILDSIVYGEAKTIVYIPDYGDTRKIKNYNKEEKPIDQNLNPVKPFSKLLKDKYQLSTIYIKAFETVYDLTDMSIMEESLSKTLKTNFIPSILTNYGIPYNELLDSCSYSISQKGLLHNDNFYFENFHIQREYFYDGLKLTTVKISRVNKNDNQRIEIIEKFKINNIE